MFAQHNHEYEMREINSRGKKILTCSGCASFTAVKEKQGFFSKTPETKRANKKAPCLKLPRRRQLCPEPVSDSLFLSLPLPPSPFPWDHLLGGLSRGRQVGRGHHTVPCHQAVTVNGADMGDMLIHLASNSTRRPVRSPVSARNKQNTHMDTHTPEADKLSHVTMNFLECIY